jgi:hypothetical protein
MNSLKSIPGLLKSLKIPSQVTAKEPGLLEVIKKVGTDILREHERTG